jgi:hypothetical protein
MEASCRAGGGAGGQGILRLRLRFAFREAQSSLRMTPLILDEI